MIEGLATRIFEANRCLASRIRARNVPGACEEIARLLDEHRTYALFQELFPDRWETSAMSFHRSSGRFGGVPERIAEFYDRVHTELFPILDDFEAEPFSGKSEFSIRPLNIDFCCDEIELDDLRTSFVATLYVFGGDADAGLATLRARTVFDEAALPEPNPFPHELVWSAQTEGRAALYRNIFELVDHSTGNPWLDSTWCNPLPAIEWKREVIEYLAANYREACERIDILEQLDQLIESQPELILTELINFWNTGSIDAIPESAELFS